MHAPTSSHAPGTQPPPAIASLIGFLRAHVPFSGMQPSHLQFLAKRLRIAYYPRGSEIDTGDELATECLYIVKQGRVVGSPESSGMAPATREIGPGDCFVAGSAARSRGARRARYRAVEDTFCLELEGESMNKLVKTSTAFRDFHDRLRSEDIRHLP